MLESRIGRYCCDYMISVHCCEFNELHTWTTLPAPRSTYKDPPHCPSLRPSSSISIAVSRYTEAGKKRGMVNMLSEDKEQSGRLKYLSRRTLGATWLSEPGTPPYIYYLSMWTRSIYKQVRRKDSRFPCLASHLHRTRRCVM